MSKPDVRVVRNTKTSCLWKHIVLEYVLSPCLCGHIRNIPLQNGFLVDRNLVDWIHPKRGRGSISTFNWLTIPLYGSQNRGLLYTFGTAEAGWKFFHLQKTETMSCRVCSQPFFAHVCMYFKITNFFYYIQKQFQITIAIIHTKYFRNTEGIQKLQNPAR